MGADTGRILPDGWDQVTPDPQPTLFPLPRGGALRGLGISEEDVRVWEERGWLSEFDADAGTIDQPQWNELAIVWDIDRSGLGHPTVSHLLSLLPRPIAVNPERLAFSFSSGWVMRPLPRPPEAEDLTVELVESWIRSVPDEDADTLWSLLDSITDRLKRSSRPS